MAGCLVVCARIRRCVGRSPTPSTRPRPHRPVRRGVGRRTAIGDADAVIADVDATVVEIQSGNEHGAAAHFEGGYGFHPVFCFADARLAAHSAVVRSDSAGGARDSIEGLRERNSGLVDVACTHVAPTAAIVAADEDTGRWQPAVGQNGDHAGPIDSGLQTAMREATVLVDTTGWPEGTRPINRRHANHPGPRTSLLRDVEYRSWDTPPTSQAISSSWTV
jgi:hypothetical protein